MNQKQNGQGKLCRKWGKYMNNIDNWALSLVNDMVQRANKQGMKRLISRKISDVLPTIVVDEDD